MNNIPKYHMGSTTRETASMSKLQKPAKYLACQKVSK